MAEPKLTDLVGLASDGSWDVHIDDEHRNSTYGDAIVAAVKVMDSGEYSYMLRGNLSVEDVRAIVEAAAPLIERAVRDKAAGELVAWADSLDYANNSSLRRVRRHAHQCAQRVAPKPTREEVLEALQCGDFVGCHLDDAGRAILPGERT